MGVRGGQLSYPSLQYRVSLLLSMVVTFCFSPSLSPSRGFGFVTFADPASVDKVLGQPHHELDSKTVGCFVVVVVVVAVCPFSVRVWALTALFKGTAPSSFASVLALGTLKQLASWLRSSPRWLGLGVSFVSLSPPQLQALPGQGLWGRGVRSLRG